MKHLTAAQAQEIPATRTDPAVVLSLSGRDVYVRHEPGGTWYEPGLEFGTSGSLPESEGPFVRLVPEPS